MLARNGAQVAVNYKTHTAEAVCDEIRDRGGRTVAIQANVSIAAEASRMVQQIEQQLGPIAVLVNNAGVTRCSRSTRSRSGTGTKCWPST